MILELAKLESGIGELSIDEPDGIAAAFNTLDSIKAEEKRVRKMFEDHLIEQLGTGSLTIGPIRYYVGKKKTTKCADLGYVLKVLKGMANDDQIARCLSSDAWKPGATTQLLNELGCPDLADGMFVTSEVPELKEGKPVRTLQKIDTRFTR